MLPLVGCALATGLARLSLISVAFRQARLFGLDRLDAHVQGDLPPGGHQHHRPSDRVWARGGTTNTGNVHRITETTPCA